MYLGDFVVIKFEKMINNDGDVSKAHSSQLEEISPSRPKLRKFKQN